MADTLFDLPAEPTGDYAPAYYLGTCPDCGREIRHETTADKATALGPSTTVRCSSSCRALVTVHHQASFADLPPAPADRDASTTSGRAAHPRLRAPAA